MPEEITAFQKKLAERRAREAQEAANKAAESSFDADLVPEQEYTLSDTDKALDAVIDNIDIIDAYRRWCSKMEPDTRKKQSEGIKISCPNPAHPDKDPSAWLNTDKQVWYCGGCQIGGDAHDIAAYHFGFPVPAYKSDGRFHELRLKMAADFGFHMESFPGGVKILVGPESTPTPEPKASSQTTVAIPEPVAEPDPELSTDNVIELYDMGDQDVSFPRLAWREFVPKDTFLDTYMRTTTIDDVVEEYHFWNAMLALGFACGRQARLDDSVPVYGNLFVCSLGASGSGKSKARYHLDSLLDKAMPHNWNDANSRGVRIIKAPGSAEMLVQHFSKPVTDPANPKQIIFYASVSGMIDFNELSALIGRANRQGNTLKPTLMQFYDMEGTVSTSSLSTGIKEARLPFASALTTTQPLALKALLGRSDDDSGFLNRWIFVGGPEKKRIAIGGVRVDMTPAVMPLQKILGWSASFKDEEFLLWSDAANKSFTSFFDTVIHPDQRKSQSALLVRMDLLMKKIILLFSANKLEKVVSADSVLEAIRCYEYLKTCYGIPAAQLGTTLQSEISEAILYQARKQWELDKKGVSLNQLAKSLKRRNYPHDILLKIVDSLVKLGFLEVEQTPAGSRGRPTVRYRYVA